MRDKRLIAPLVLQSMWFFYIGRAVLGHYGFWMGLAAFGLAAYFTALNFNWIWRITHGKM